MSNKTNPFEESVLSSLSEKEEKEEKLSKDLSIGRRKDNIFMRAKPKKVANTYYLEENIIDFFAELSDLLNLSASGMINDLLKHSIINNEDLKELASVDEEAKKLLREFIESIN